ncbi:hypothetical protein DY218_11205 [Streptomyces triticagri]|uniref:Glycosyltransferase n=1 Tax=Streptomyces triticagri TaxID=2293568 RepID=A0A372M7Q6_9ACTN|nr:glycosyltransferase [Streptomyces triticagri]RFU86630.1 hypothetical protein DY218_11205 [Streptomyces triticagri]
MRIAVIPIDAIGHVNPLLPIVGELAAHPDVEVVCSFGPESLADPFTAAGAQHISLAAASAGPTPAGLSDLAYKSFVQPLPVASRHLQAVAEFRPDVVLYDVFSFHGAIAGRTLDIPSVSLVTFPGYGALGEDFAVQHGRPHPALEEANAHYQAQFSLDLLGEGLLPTLFPSKDLSVVTSIESLSRAPDTSTPILRDRLAPYVGTLVYVGPSVGPVRCSPPPQRSGRETERRLDEALLFRTLEEAKERGRAVVLFSLGTVLTDFRFHSPVGGAPTGRQFLNSLLARLTAAVGGRPDLLVVAAVGTELAREEEPEWPDNFLISNFLPQREILNRHADVFLTHHGMNSTAESILACVPMVSLPGVGDQITNAQIATEHRAAVAPWDLRNPYATVTPQLLEEAVTQALSSPVHRDACASLRAQMALAGGARRAAEHVVALPHLRSA